MPTIRDVAKRAGVAPITVSRVINNDSYVSDETRRRVEQAIAELEYIPNALAPSLRSKRTKTIALVLSDITNPFWTTVARGVEDTANKQGYHMIVGNTDESPAKQDEYLLFLLGKQVDGFLLVPAQSTSRSLDLLQKRHVPLVILDRRVAYVDVDAVRSDSVGGAYALTRHLLELGHHAIAVVTGPQHVSTASDRVEGYLRALEEVGLRDQMRVHWGEYNPQSGYEIAKQILQTSPRPTAFLGANNFISIGIIRALHEAGVRVPEEMSVVTFDDFPLTMTIAPFFTVAAQPAYEMGKKGAELLLARLSDETPAAYQEIVLPTELIIRQSSAAPPITRK